MVGKESFAFNCAVCARDAKGLVLFCLFQAKKTEATAEPGAARPGARKVKRYKVKKRIISTPECNPET